MTRSTLKTALSQHWAHLNKRRKAMSTQNKRMSILILALILVFGGILVYHLFAGYMMKRYFARFASPAVTVSSVTAKQRDWKPHFSAVGNFVAIKGVNVNSQAAGDVVAIHFESGQYVEKDTPLIDLDDSVDQATLKFNQAELALQHINHTRQTDLLKRAATSSSTVDAAKAKLLQAEAEVEKTLAQIRQKHITAPFSGQIGIRQVNLGEYITVGNTSIAPLQLLDPLFMTFYLPEQLITRLKIGQIITFSVAHNPDLLFEGKITAINAKVDSNTHTIEVQATLPNCPTDALRDPTHSPLVTTQKGAHDQKTRVICNSELNTKNHVSAFNFIPGMFASIEVDQPKIPHVITLPSTSISYSLYGNSVFVIETTKADPNDPKSPDVLQVKQVFVSTGEQQGNDTIIKKGIRAGQKVVSSGELKLQNGTRVLINNEVPLPEITDPEQLGQ